MEYRKKYERLEVKSNPGSPIRNIYGSKLDKNKNIIIEKKGEENLYAYINSFAESVDINVLLARFANGDKEALLQRAGAYIDIAAMPTNINEFLEYSRNAQALFDTLPIEIKQKFNNNVVEFISSIGNDEWNAIMNTSQQKIKNDFSNESKKVSKINKDNIKTIENPAVDSVEVQESEIK